MSPAGINPVVDQLMRHVDGAVFGALKVLAVLLVYWVARGILRRAIEGVVTPLARRVEKDSPGRAITLRSLLNSIAQYVLLFITAMMVLRAVGMDVTAILTGAGVAGLAVGFGAQKLVRDVITGFFILLEDQFSVGETITVVGNTGVVEEMGMRTTRLRDDAGKRILIANGDITTVVNHSRSSTLVTVDVSVAPDTRIESIRELVDGLGGDLGTLRELLDEPPVVRGVTAFDGTKVTFRVTARAQPGRQQEAELALRQALRERLLSSGARLV
jgi:small conductance mechanosensitive channel